MQELIKTGIVRSDEAKRIGDEESTNVFGSNWWMPLKWAIEILNRSQKDGLLTNAPGYSHMGTITHHSMGHHQRVGL